MLKATRLLCRMKKHYRGLVPRKPSLSRSVADKGNLTPHDKGADFTSENVYRSGAMHHMLRTRAAIQKQSLGEKVGNTLQHQDVDWNRFRELVDFDTPATPAERKASKMADDLALGLSTRAVQQTDSARMDRKLVRSSKREDIRRASMQAKYAGVPSAKAYNQLFHKVRLEADEDERVQQLQNKLAEQHGILPTSRIDAYMMSDDSIFPEWTERLPFRIRDRVKYGNLGLSDDDEAQRLQLQRMSHDKRMREWERLKKAKEYKAGIERMLTPTEVRQLRRGNAVQHTLHHRRKQRASMMKQLAMRKPDYWTAWPSGQVDYSKRVALIARHVENGVETKGQWPLDEERVANARIKRMEDEANETFLTQNDPTYNKAKRRMDGSVHEVLRTLDDNEERPIKRISKRLYFFRYNAVKHGDQDEHGRNYRQMSKQMTMPAISARTMKEFDIKRKVHHNLPNPNAPGKRVKTSDQWPRVYDKKSFRQGMPSQKYGY